MISTAAVIDLADAIVTAAIGSLADLGGPDVEQAFAYDLAHAASAVATARSLLDYGAKGDSEARIACVFTADVLHDLAGKILGRETLWGVTPGALDGASDFIAEYRNPDVIASLAESSGPLHLTDDMDMVRDTFRAFAQDVIAPHAEHVHRSNGDVPEEIISGLAELGAFGLSVPAEYGGFSDCLLYTSDAADE